MKIKMILALTVFITLAVTSVNAQSVRERKYYQRDGISNDYGRSRAVKDYRYGVSVERHHFRRDRFYGRHHRNHSYHEKRYQRYDKRHNGRYSYSYRNKQRRFD